jgi:hypothetical protein
MRIQRIAFACLLILAGCSSKPASVKVERADTGAEEQVKRFFTAVISKDWAAAYRCLASESKARYSAAQFAQRGSTYLRTVGFEPAEVRVTGCEERGDEAVAHVSLVGNSSSHRPYKDAVTLQRGASQWTVVLPASFGRPPAK